MFDVFLVVMLTLIVFWFILFLVECQYSFQVMETLFNRFIGVQDLFDLCGEIFGLCLEIMFISRSNCKRKVKRQGLQSMFIFMSISKVICTKIQEHGSGPWISDWNSPSMVSILLLGPHTSLKS